MQGKAQICGFSTKRICQCGVQLKVDYTSEVIKDVIVAGISDESVRTGVLETDAVEERSVNEIISLVERKEKARKAYSTPAVLAVSSFKRQNNPHKPGPPPESNKIPCPRCKKPYRRFTGKNSKAYECCLNCFRVSRTQRKTISSLDAEDVNDDDSQDVALIQGTLGIGCINVTNESDNGINVFRRIDQQKRDHPRITLHVIPEGSLTSATIVGIADTGAQSNILGYNNFIACGFDVNLLNKVSLNVYTANKQPLNIVGGFAAKVEGIIKGRVMSCNVMIYVSKSVTGLFVSFDTLIKLQVVSSKFPLVGCLRPRGKITCHDDQELSLVDMLTLVVNNSQ